MMVSQPKSWIEIDSNALLSNVTYIRTIIGDKVKLFAVVKNNAYGHDINTISTLLQSHVDGLCVAHIIDGIKLRNLDITCPILVMNTSLEDVEMYVKYDLIATLGNFEQFEVLPPNTRVHLKFDIGMGRFGFLYDQYDMVKQKMNQHSQIIYEGLYIHLPTAHQQTHHHTTRKIIMLFKKLISYFPKHFTYHISNSCATLYYRDSHFDMVRIGAAIYGYLPNLDEVEELTPVLSWHTKLINVKYVPKNTSISYGMTWHTPYDGYVGIIPIGYANGLSNLLSNGISVSIGNKLYPQVGTITMDFSMIWLGKDKYEVGERVTLLSRDHATFCDWSKKSGTHILEQMSLLKDIPCIIKN